ncbi:MAG: adenylate/guanylate cyclase domain-containing protein [Cyanobacteria bacterium P01_C01_bin.118]
MTQLQNARFRSSTPQSIQTSVRQVIAKESLNNERKVAFVKVIVVLISSILDVLVFFFPGLIGKTAIAPTVALISVSACFIYIGFWLTLRHPSAWRWLPKLQIAIPLFDSLSIALFTTNIADVLGVSQPQIVTNVAAFCCLLAVSGGIRIRRWASTLTTVLALANFSYAAFLFELPPTVAVFALFTILGTGLMGMLTSSIVLRQGKNEAGRLLMQQFLPENVVEAAFETPTELIEEPMTFDVTIMMTDLRGFTHYAEKLEPAAVFEFLNQLQGLLSTIVENHDGWVNSFMGDGMLAVFGAPKELDSHADKAIQAAQTILAEVKHCCPLPMGIGLHSGSIVAGCLGSDGHLEFSVIGDTVNVASRLESLTKQVNNPLLISKATQQRLQSYSLKSLGKLPIRGRDEHIEVFVLPQGGGSLAN